MSMFVFLLLTRRSVGLLVSATVWVSVSTAAFANETEVPKAHASAKTMAKKDLPKWKQHEQTCNLLTRSGNYSEAVSEITLAIATCPVENKFDLLVRRAAFNAMNLKRRDLALSDLLQALPLRHGNNDIYASVFCQVLKDLHKEAPKTFAQVQDSKSASGNRKV